ncbi:MAG: hypothetical protein LBQ73_02665 [Tannerellaceae bacterium]|jgi:hypothetical protein|nr:hypothetical protein [Tannerellaceae bacterium]
MKRHIKIKTGLIFSAMLLAPGLRAQVVIGSSTTSSEPAALLQIKEYDAAPGSGGKTATKGGLLLPRVELKGLSDITVLPANAGKDKKSDLTGLLVYNVNTSGMEEGIYEWDGERWYLLEPSSKESDFVTLKSLQRAPITESNAPKLRMGMFEFRIEPVDKKPQCRCVDPLEKNTDFWFNVTRFWDFNEINTVNNELPNVGYTFDIKKKTISTTDSQWFDFHTDKLKKDDQRFDVWLADPVNNHLYNIRFLIFQSTSAPAYIILAAEY